jgi:response regulator NasT
MNAMLNTAYTSKPKILLVDDDRLILVVLAQGLANAGYQIVTAESVAEAETILFSAEPPDLLVLDVQMPGGSGLELAKNLSEWDGAGFILLTAYNDDIIVEQASASGALGYLVKPIDVPQLIPAIEAAWARAKDLKELRETGLQLQIALASERDISIAVGITMQRYHLNRRDAFEKLRKVARDQRRRLADLANEVIVSIETLTLVNKDKK